MYTNRFLDSFSHTTDLDAYTLDNSAPFVSKLVIDLFKYYITLNKENTSEYVLGTCM